MTMKYCLLIALLCSVSCVAMNRKKKRVIIKAIEDLRGELQSELGKRNQSLDEKTYDVRNAIQGLLEHDNRKQVKKSAARVAYSPMHQGPGEEYVYELVSAERCACICTSCCCCLFISAIVGPLWLISKLLSKESA